MTILDTGQHVDFLHHTNGALTLTIVLPANPQDGQTVSITSTNGITLLTLNAAATIVNTTGAMLGSGSVTYMYGKVDNKWFKIR